MDGEPKRAWWRRKRWWVAAVTAAFYPVSFAPACWVLMRLVPDNRSAEWQVIRFAYRPAAEGLKASPAAAQRFVCRVVNVGKTERTVFTAQVTLVGIVVILPPDPDAPGAMRRPRGPGDVIEVFSLW